MARAALQGTVSNHPFQITINSLPVVIAQAPRQPPTENQLKTDPLSLQDLDRASTLRRGEGLWLKSKWSILGPLGHLLRRSVAIVSTSYRIKKTQIRKIRENLAKSNPPPKKKKKNIYIYIYAVVFNFGVLFFRFMRSKMLFYFGSRCKYLRSKKMCFPPVKRHDPKQLGS